MRIGRLVAFGVVGAALITSGCATTERTTPAQPLWARSATALPKSIAGVKVAPDHNQGYVREHYLRNWDRVGSSTYNVRDRVLADESKTPVKCDPGSGWRCKVVEGRWFGLYSGKTFTDARKLDVDHVVPLEEAHRSGGWKWPREKKRKYANDLTDPDHLIAVWLSENRKKGSRDPTRYMPPRKQFHCRYIAIWLSIKRRWNLTMDEAEARKIRSVLAGCPRPRAQFGRITSG